MKTITLLALLFLATGCIAQTTEDPAPAAAACPAVECAFIQGTCDPATMTYRETRDDVGPGCWMKTAACYPKSTPAGCEPADCYFEQGAGCGR